MTIGQISMGTMQSFPRDCELTNYSGFTFKMGISKTVRLLDGDAVEKAIGAKLSDSIRMGAFETDRPAIRPEG